METALLVGSQVFMVASHPAKELCDIKIIVLLCFICTTLQLSRLRLPSRLKQYLRPGSDIVPFYGCVIFPAILLVDDKPSYIVQWSLLVSLITLAFISVFCRMKLLLKMMLLIVIVGTFLFYRCDCTFEIKIFSITPSLSACVINFAVFFSVIALSLSASHGSFSAGEVVLVGQMVTVLCYVDNIRDIANNSISLIDISFSMAKMTIFLLLVSLILFNFFQSIMARTVIFYSLTFCVIVTTCVLYTPWLIDCMKFAAKFLMSNYPYRLRLLFFWIFVSLLCFVFVIVRSNQRKATTIERKVFHAFILMVYIPGFTFDIPLLFFCSVVAAVMFVLVGTMQAFQIEPIGYLLHGQFDRFKGTQDTGSFILTPIYLLLGLSLPLWMSCSKHPDLLKAVNLLPPIASYGGIISVGIGDAFASVVGSKYGTLRFPRRRKTVEGTLASILAQVLFVYALSLSGSIDNGSGNVILAIIAGALVEAYTHEVDNLVVPVLVYFLLDII